MGHADSTAKTGRLVLVRHGESEWNQKNQFTGWVDVSLTEKGIEQAKEAGKQLRDSGFQPDVVYSTNLSRASSTAREMLNAMGTPSKEIKIDDRMIERHYGDVTGYNKKQLESDYVQQAIKDGKSEEEAKEIAAGKIKTLRRSYDNPPPAMQDSNPYHPNKNSQKGEGEPKFIIVPDNDAKTESLSDVVKRVKPFWEEEILPRLQNGENIMISAHGNSLRALTMIIKNMSKDQIIEYNMDNAKPYIYDISSKKGAKDWEYKEVDLAAAAKAR
ncbi:MAG: 2,3-diphosphoglycerate-dependent phosphoglycerate mutase [Rickettsiales bacterium]